MGIVTSVAKIGEVLATWLDPERREKAVLRAAIEAAEQLLDSYERKNRFKDMPDKEVIKLQAHYYKQWRAWKDGK